MCLDNEIIFDIRRVAASLNTSELGFSEYVNNGGKFVSQMVEEEYNSFASYCELAGIKGYVD